MFNSKITGVIKELKVTKFILSIIGHFLNNEDTELKDLQNELTQTKNNLESARCNFDYALDNEMIEYYTYIIMANEIKYGYLTKKYKGVQETKDSDKMCIVPEGLKERRAIEWDYLKESEH